MDRDIKQLRIKRNKCFAKIYAIKSDRADNETLKLYYALLSRSYSTKKL